MEAKYDNAFFEYAATSSTYAAGVVTALLAPLLKVESVLDVGCASGTWLNAWSKTGVGDIHGVDGDYLDINLLEIARTHFTPTDLNSAFDLDRKFDLVQSLEVGEHIQPESSEAFIDSIARHASRFVLFSAAPPGQGGEYHVNERDYDFWRAGLGKHDYVAVDAVRPAIIGDARISYWYRYNMFLYVHESAVDSIDASLRQHIVPDDQPLSDVSPAIFKLRKSVVRQLPIGVQNSVARIKAQVLPTGRF